LNNGFEDVVSNKDYNKNQKDTIVFGAENAAFFYQPFEYITGNKMYYIKDKRLNRYTGLFISTLLNTSIKDCGFGYGKGLTGTRMKSRSIILPTDKQGNPDWAFMEKYMREIEAKLIRRYKNYLGTLTTHRNLGGGDCKPFWREFRIDDIFIINPGKRLTQADMKKGKRPFIGASDSNNGITAFVSNSNISQDENVLGVNYNGSVVENFYHPYQCIFSDDVKRFRLKNHVGNKYLYLFLKQEILKQKEKYQYGYKFNEVRMKKQVFLLPASKSGQPDYDYMENTMRRIEIKQFQRYMSYLETCQAA
jgi:hypothetical protein